VITIIVPFIFPFMFIIWMWAGAVRGESTLLIADAISCSILFGRGPPSSVLKIRHLSAMADPDVGTGPGLAGAL
jgi:hypothetical protein